MWKYLPVLVSASLQWVPVSRGCQSSVGVSFEFWGQGTSAGWRINGRENRDSAGVMHQLACVHFFCIRREIAPPHLPTDFLPSALPRLACTVLRRTGHWNCPSLKTARLHKSFAFRPRSFAFHLLRCKIPWILLATVDLVYTRPLTWPPIFFTLDEYKPCSVCPALGLQF
jgi:hypothetical protein